MSSFFNNQYQYYLKLLISHVPLDLSLPFANDYAKKKKKKTQIQFIDERLNISYCLEQFGQIFLIHAHVKELVFPFDHCQRIVVNGVSCSHLHED